VKRSLIYEQFRMHHTFHFTHWYTFEHEYLDSILDLVKRRTSESCTHPQKIGQFCCFLLDDFRKTSDNLSKSLINFEKFIFVRCVFRFCALQKIIYLSHEILNPFQFSSFLNIFTCISQHTIFQIFNET
jgi:hypothetical protein